MNPIRKIYQFLLLFELICFLIMLLELIESNFDLTVPISFYITDQIGFSSSFNLNWTSIYAFFGGVAILYIISSVNIVESGLNDEGSKTVKQLVTFIVIIIVMVNSVTYIIFKSDLLSQYILFIDLLIILIHFLNFMIGVDN
ncbi:MAG: hypothetical protein ACFFKA_05780 [Candidatus Thorarchaeota archaeon]